MAFARSGFHSHLFDSHLAAQETKAQRSGMLCPRSHSWLGPRQDEAQLGIENHRMTPPGCPQSQASFLVSSKSLPPLPGSVCSHTLWPAPAAPLGSWCPESGKFPGPGRDKGCLAQVPGQCLPTAPLIADQMVLPVQLLARRLQ